LAQPGDNKVTVKESPSPIAAPTPLPGKVAPRYELNRRDRWRVRAVARAIGELSRIRSSLTLSTTWLVQDAADSARQVLHEAAEYWAATCFRAGTSRGRRAALGLHQTVQR
jgi:hypothetical protein